MTRLPRTAASHALHEGLGALGDSRLMAETTAAGGIGGGQGGAGSPGGGGGGGDGDAGDGDGDVGAGTRTGVAPGEGDPDPRREFEEAVAHRVGPGPKGPKPLLPAPTFSSSSLDYDSGAADAGSESGATGFEPDPADRVGARRDWGLRARIGPATADDAWMWQGVPPGCGLIRRYEPGERRYYMGDDGGPSLKTLPPAWPPGQGPDT